MSALLHEIAEQPQTLRDLAHFYAEGDGLASLRKVPASTPLLLTGMGASFHVAAITGLYLHRLGIPALALEATDLLNYSRAIRGTGVIVYVSQSGASAEVRPVVQAAAPQTRLVGVTNDLESILAQHAAVVLPLLAGSEALVATKDLCERPGALVAARPPVGRCTGCA